MEDYSIIALVRTICGAAILAVSMVTGINGQIQMVSLFMMGVPFELLGRKKEAK